jgi:hypothetical protein
MAAQLVSLEALAEVAKSNTEQKIIRGGTRRGRFQGETQGRG